MSDFLTTDADPLHIWRAGYRKHLISKGMDATTAADRAAKINYRADLYPRKEDLVSATSARARQEKLKLVKTSVEVVAERPVELIQNQDDLGAQGELFVLELLDASLQGMKSDNDSSEAPYYALSTNDLKPYKWQSQDGNLIVRIIPPKDLDADEESVASHRLAELGRDGKKALSRATIPDKDILIYLATQLVLSLDAGQKMPTDRRVHFVAYDLLRAIKRHTNKNAYQLLKRALERLTRTYIYREKRLPCGQWQSQEGFSLISNWRAIRNTTDDRMSHIEVELADPFAAALNARNVITLHRDYFDLKPLAKAVYGIAAKHCGRQVKWQIGLEALRNKTGFRRDIYEFKTELLALATELPGYLIGIDVSKSVVEGKVTFYNRKKQEAALVLPKMNQNHRRAPRTSKQSAKARQVTG